MNNILKISFYNQLKKYTIPWSGIMALLCMLIALYYAFWDSPIDYQQKETVKIMYIHVPAAWLGLLIYGFMGVCAITGFVWRNSLSFIYARAAAPIGMCFTLISLVTGAIWGKPMWGTWWVWDARLTSMLVLFFLYIGYILLVRSFGDSERGYKTGAILLILGLINLPIIKFSVEWWSTLHQSASVFKSGGASIDAGMLRPLFISASGLLLFAYTLGMIRVESLLLSRKLQRLLMLEARRGM